MKILFLDIDGVLNSDYSNHTKWTRFEVRPYNKGYVLFNLDCQSIVDYSDFKSDLQSRADYYNKRSYQMRAYGLDYILVSNLKRIIDATNCKIVFSTSWRYFKDHHIVGSDWRKSLAYMLDVDQNSTFIGETPDISECGGWESGSITRRRGLEIKFWIDYHKDIAIPGNFTYCIIDDEICDIITVMPEDHIVHTDMKSGLTFDDALKAIDILNKE